MATKFKPNEKNEINGTENADAIAWESTWNRAITVNSAGGNDIIDFTGSKYNNILNGGNGNDTIYGGDGNDTISTGNGDDTVLSGLGDDIIYGVSGTNLLKGGSGNDTIYGGINNDKIYGGNGHDTILGGTGNDTIYGENGNDFIKGGEGNDTLVGGNGSDTIEGGSGKDTIYGTVGTNILKGQGGDDTIYGGTEKDTIYCGFGDDTALGGAGNDIIYGEYGHNILKGGDGNDTIYGGLNEDRIYGEKGNDTIYLSEDGGSLFFNQGDGNDVVKYSYLDTNNTLVFKDFDINKLRYIKSKDNLVIKYGQNYSDSVTIENFFSEYPSVDSAFKSIRPNIFDIGPYIKIKGSSGKALSVHDINPKIEIENIKDGGSPYSDTYTITKNDEISVIYPVFNINYYDEINTDTLYFKDSTMNDLEFTVCGKDLQIGFNKVDGEAQNYVVLRHYMSENFPVNIVSSDKMVKSLDDMLNEKGVQSGFNVTEDGEIIGTRFKDIINGTTKDDTIYGNEGDDVIKGGQGKDTIVGGDGDDKIYGYDASHLNVNDGGNLLIGGLGSDIIYGTAGNDIIYGGADGDEWYNSYYSAGNDTIYAGAGDDVIYCGSGNQTIYTGAGNDVIYCGGRDGNDTIYLGAGNNVIYEYGENYNFNNTYVISNLSDLNTIFSKYSGSDYIVLSNTNHNDVILRFDVTQMNIGESFFTKPNLYVTKTNDFGNETKGVIIDKNFDGWNYPDRVRKITTADGYYLTNTQIFNLAQNVRTWLCSNGFENTQQVFDSGNQTNINALIAQFQNANWQHA